MQTVIIMNFTHVYEKETFMKNKRFQWIDCTEITGTDCYCDEDALQTLTRKIAPYSPEGIHFIDSGNYHYLSKLWTDKIRRPFVLVVFDHHPDMQPTLFENLMSCGSWVKEVLDTNPFCRKVCIIGASEKLIRETGLPRYDERLVFYSNTDLTHEKAWEEFAAAQVNEPVYISVDKDVLSRKYAVTNWDQGSLSLEELEELLQIILRKQHVIGLDICGECPETLSLFEEKKNDFINNRTNENIFSTFVAAKQNQKPHQADENEA